MAAEEILKQIEQLGYTTAILRERKTLALIAEPNINIDPKKRGPERCRQENLSTDWADHRLPNRPR